MFYCNKFPQSKCCNSAIALTATNVPYLLGCPVLVSRGKWITGLFHNDHVVFPSFPGESVAKLSLVVWINTNYRIRCDFINWLMIGVGLEILVFSIRKKVGPTLQVSWAVRIMFPGEAVPQNNRYTLRADCPFPLNQWTSQTKYSSKISNAPRILVGNTPLPVNRLDCMQI